MRRLRPVHRWLLTVFGLLILAIVGIAYHLNADPVATIPRQVFPTPNAFDYDVKACNALVSSAEIKVQEALGHRPYGMSGPLPKYSLTQKEALVRENSAALKLIRAGFTYPFLGPLRAENELFPYDRKFMTLGQLFRLEGNVKAAHGDWNGAVTSDLDAMRLGSDIPHGGNSIGSGTGIFCQDQGRIPLWALVSYLTAKQARDATFRLEVIQSKQLPYADDMQQEEWSGQKGLLNVFHKQNWRQELIDDMFISLVDNDAARIQRPIYQAKILFTSKQAMYADYTRYMDQQIRIARAPYAAKLPVKALPLDPLHSLMFSSMDFDYGTLRLPDTRCETDNALVIGMLALRAYQLEHGALPNTLQMLVPAYIHQVPNDPFALSEPLQYRRTGQKYVLYSIGPDGIDDHGVPVYDPTQPAPRKPGGFNRRYWVTDGSKGDIVAGINVD